MQSTHIMPTRAEARRGLLLIILTALLWGTIGVATRALYEMSDTNPLTVGFFRLAFAVPVLFLACWKVMGRPFFVVPRRDLGLMLLLGAAMALYQASYFAAIAQMGVTIAVLVALCSAPVLVALLSMVLLGERLTGRVLVALVCAVGGTALLVGAPSSGAGIQQANLIGLLLALGAGLSYAVVTLCSRTLAGRYHPLQPITVGIAAGSLMLLPFALAAGLVLSYPPAGWALLIHLGVLPTALGYLLFLSGLRTTTATAASIATLLEPLTSAALAWMVFQERLGPLGILGGLLLLGAMALLTWKPPARER
jgi:DME family drug/metabolite transporter